MHQRWLAGAVAAALVAAACSGDDGDTEAVTTTTTTIDDQRPDGTAADLSELLEGGNGPFLGSATPVVLPGDWIEEERVAAGTATSYRAAADLPADGRFDLVEDATAEYRTRVVVRRPEDPDAFNGTVVVEWLNVSGGIDAGPDFTFLTDELLRGGYAWVGVSAQHIGVEGGAVAVTVEGAEGIAGVGLRTLDAERYGSLRHPGDAFAYDVYTQVARALRRGDALGDLEPERLLAVGESQSAFMLTTYVNGVQPRAGAFDGFLVHSRGRGAAPLGEPGRGIDVATTFGGEATTIRTDVDVPVLVVETETDVLSILSYVDARQDDTDRFRLWEVAGTAHADRYILGARADTVDCGGPVNDGPQHFVVKAALRALDTWVRDGQAPPVAARLDVDETARAFRRDADGVALGGVRTPHVDAPVSTLTGEARPGGSIICLLLGSSTPLPPGRLAERYGSAEAYLDAYRTAADAAIAAGFVLEEDRDALLGEARPERFAGLPVG